MVCATQDGAGALQPAAVKASLLFLGIYWLSAKLASNADAASAGSYGLCGRGPCFTKHQTQLVARRVAHISQVAVIARCAAPAGCIFNGYAAVGQSSVECAVQLVDGGGFKPQRKAVVVRGRLTVAWRGDHQPRAIVIPHIALKAVDVDMRGRRRAQDTEHGVIELAAGGEVIGA